MNKRNKLLASLLVSTQLLGIIAPVNVSAEEAIQGQSTIDIGISEEFLGTELTLEDVEQIEYNKIRGIYSESLDNRADELLERASNIESNKELDDLIKDFVKIDEHFDQEDVVFNTSDREVIGMGKLNRVHERIRNYIYTMDEGGSSRMINYMNQLIMAITRGATGFELQVNDLYATNPFVSVDLEVYRVHQTMIAYVNMKEDGQDLELEIVGGRLVSPLHEELGIEFTPPVAEEVEVEEVERTPMPENNIRTDDDAYRTSDRENYGSDLGSTSGSYYEFDEVNGRRIRVDYTIEYVDGKQQRSETRTVEATGLTSMWSDSYSELFNSTPGTVTERHDTDRDEDDERSRLTLQYTLNKDETFPTYIDTGLFADVNGNVSYEDLYEVLYQIAVNIDNGYLVEDTDKLLIVVEGRPVYITEEKENYTQSEVEEMFEDFEKVGLIVSETRIGTTNSLEWQLRTGQEQNVVVDGREVELKNSPDIRGDRVVLPVVEIMSAIGADVNEGGNLITARYGDDVVTFELGVSEARVNGNLVDLTVPVEADDRGTLTANLTPIFAQLNIESVWDEEESTLFLDNTLAATTVEVEEFGEDVEEDADNEGETEEDE